MRVLFIFYILSIFIYANEYTKGLEYLNHIRQNAGLITFQKDTLLQDAAKNHADYIHDTGYVGHYENNSTHPSQYYTGVSPSDRGKKVGYKGGYYLENLSVGTDDVYDSIDGLFSAIYHRFGFFNLYIDSVGIGINDINKSFKVYNYNMGNSRLVELCEGNSFTGFGTYYHGVCLNDSDFKIEKDTYENALNYYATNAIDYVIWPSNNSIDIPPVFFEESPDPLPDYGVSGYPISIEFNDITYKDKTINLQSFKLYDKNNNEVTNTRLMDQANDPNTNYKGKHSKYQFTLFPLERLDWRSEYSVEFTYSIDGQSNTINWSFETRGLVVQYYVVDSSVETFDVKSGEYYSLYIKPKDGNDTLYNLNYGYSYTTDDPLVYVDEGNVLIVKLVGEVGDYCNITLADGRVIELNIATDDNAIIEDGNITAGSNEKFGSDYLANKTFYPIWYGEGEDVNGTTLNNVPVVVEVSYDSNGTGETKGILNFNDTTKTKWSVQNNKLYDIWRTMSFIPNRYNQYVDGNLTYGCIKTNFYEHGIFDGVELIFAKKEDALSFANQLTAPIENCPELTPFDNPPFVLNSISNVEVLEDANNTIIDLSNVFDDNDSTTQIVKTIVGTYDTSLIGATVSADSLIIDYLENQHGVTYITINGNNGKDVNDTFKITVNSVNDIPIFNLQNIMKQEDFEDFNITLNATDVDDTNITYALGDYNSSLVSMSILNNKLLVESISDAYGITTVEVNASDGKAIVTQEFNLTIEDVNDTIEQPTEDNTTNEDLNNSIDNNSSNIIYQSNENNTTIDINSSINYETINNNDNSVDLNITTSSKEFVLNISSIGEVSPSIKDAVLPIEKLPVGTKTTIYDDKVIFRFPLQNTIRFEKK